jgi:adenosylmethionine-8-amino-7-oxononanoate aminotransferase
MVGIELTGFPPEHRIGHQVTLACRQRGVIVRNIGDVVVLMPAPAMPIELVERLCNVVTEAIDELMNS